jgi:hypothetical protein
MLDEQQVEVDIISSSTIFSDTIYTVGEQWLQIMEKPFLPNT